jgi:hypothetical protein
MILYDTEGCIVNPLPLEDLPIVGHSDKNAKVMMHDDGGIGVDGLKELDPGPSTHDGIHVDGIMEHGPSHIHYVLVPLPTVVSNHIISRQPMATLTAIPTIFCLSLGCRTI